MQLEIDNQAINWCMERNRYMDVDISLPVNK